jgi:transcriptional regulator with XRE-family HTH domain
MPTELQRIISSIGPKLRALRKQTGLSLQQLSARSDVSPAAIHKIEQGDMVPTITTLLKIAGALNRPVSYFVDEEQDSSEPIVFTPSAEHRPIYTSHQGISLSGISGPYGRFFLAGARATVIPAASSGDKPMEHPGEELIYVVEGRLDFEVNGRCFSLGPEDALHFRTDQKHSWANHGAVPAKAVWLALRPQ